MAGQPELPTAIVRYPASPADPIRVGFEGVNIEAVIGSREVLATFDGFDEFKVQGVYVLIKRSEQKVRPGKTDKTLQARLRQHLNENDAAKTLLDWDTAVLYRRIGGEFNGNETAALETLLHKRLDAAANLERVGSRSTYKDPRTQRDIEDQLLPAVMIGLRLAGLDVRSQKELDAIAAVKPKHRSDEDDDE